MIKEKRGRVWESTKGSYNAVSAVLKNAGLQRGCDHFEEACLSRIRVIHTWNPFFGLFLVP